MTSFLSLLLIMLPLKPADFPANMVWSDDLCTWAVDEAVKSCLNSMKEATDRATNRETNDAELIKAYETRLTITEKSLNKLERHNKIMLYVAGGLALVASSTTALLIWGK